MSEIQRPSIAHRLPREIQPRLPHREIAELLAAAILRMRTKDQLIPTAAGSEVSLDFTANQRVNANPSYTEGVQK